MSTPHTPGPWHVILSSNPKNGSAWRDIVSGATEFSPSYVGEAQEHDARLIAAAPDLLAALEAIVALAGFSTDWNSGKMEQMPDKLPQLDTKTFCMARAAIAKATTISDH